MIDFKVCRKIAGYLFLAANISLFVWNFSNTNWYQLLSGLFLASCSIALILSAKNHRWLFYCGFSLMTGSILASISNEGNQFTYSAVMVGIVIGLLDFRAGWQRETKKQYALPYPLSAIDRYPLTAASVIEMIFCVLLAIGSVLNEDFRLLTICFIWIIAHMFLIASDEFLRERIVKGSNKPTTKITE